MAWWRKLLGLPETRAATPGQHPRDTALASMFNLWAETGAGVVVTPDTAMQSPAVASSVRILSDAISTLPLDLYERTGENESRRAVGNDLHNLVHDQPCEWLTSADWRRRVAMSLLLRGNQYNRITYAGGLRPVAIEPIKVGEAWPFRTPDRKVWYRVGGATLRPDEVLHFRGPYQEGDALEAASPVVMNRELIGTSIAAARYVSRFFANAAMPKLALVVPGVIGPEAAQRLKTNFEARHGGVENAHRVAVLEGGTELKALGLKNDEAQTLELYRHLAGEVASRVFGIPPHLSGDMEKQTSWGSGIEQMDIGYVKHVVRPYLEAIEQQLSATLLSREARRRFYFEFNIEGMLRGDLKSRVSAYALLIQWGVVSINEVRRRENMPPVPSGDVRLHPLNMVPVGRLTDTLDDSAEKAAEAVRALRHDMLNGFGKGEEIYHA